MKTEQEDEPTKVQGDIEKCDLSKNEKNCQWTVMRKNSND